MSLAADVTFLKTCAEPFGPDALQATLNVMGFLDQILGDDPFHWPTLPRGYYIDVTGCGLIQLCAWGCWETDEDFAKVLAHDIASGFLEEMCNGLDAPRSERIRSE